MSDRRRPRHRVLSNTTDHDLLEKFTAIDRNIVAVAGF